MVPHLVTALTGPINELEQRIIDSMPATEIRKSTFKHNSSKE